MHTLAFTTTSSIPLSTIMLLFTLLTTALATPCTHTVFTAIPIHSANTATTTVYTLTTYTTQYWDCRGCDGVVVVPYGHIWFETRSKSYETTVTASEAWNSTVNLCRVSTGTDDTATTTATTAATTAGEEGEVEGTSAVL